MSLSLDIKTIQRRARLMHAVGNLDYSIVELDDGYVQYRFDCGSGEGVAKSNAVRVNDGLWHSIVVERNSRNAKITIDGTHTAEGSAPYGNSVLNLDHNYVYFGGEVSSSASDVLSGFEGCLKSISLGNEELPLTGSNSVGVMQQLHDVEFHCRGLYLEGACARVRLYVYVVHDVYVLVCHALASGVVVITITIDHHATLTVCVWVLCLGTCQSTSCANGGTCQMVGAGQHMCLCRGRFAGARCELDSDPCVVNPCLHGGTSRRVTTLERTALAFRHY